jgi:D-serine deaminase-like pyridoxal phosphate-dependent protein
MPGQMALPKLPVDTYHIRQQDSLLTPALVIYPETVDANIRTTLQLLGGDSNRWRPHVKTAKLGFTMRQLVHRGMTNLKCATTLELLVACQAGAKDVLVAYPMQGANARRVREIAEQFRDVRISALLDSPASMTNWAGGNVEIFIDVNPGMDRTGIEQVRIAEIVQLAFSVRRAGLTFRGLHYYDGHLGKWPVSERTVVAHRGYDHLLEIVSELERGGISGIEVITAGTPAFPCTASYPGFTSSRFIHRASPGTIVYGDLTSLSQLPLDYTYRPAVVVVSRVVSHPTANRFTCDAGHKALAIDCGIPNCAVAGRPDLLPGSPNEEHLPMEVPEGARRPAIGELIYLIPRHVCPTVNNFNEALIVSDGQIMAVEPVSARGRDWPILASALPSEENKTALSSTVKKVYPWTN